MRGRRGFRGWELELYCYLRVLVREGGGKGSCGGDVECGMMWNVGLLGTLEPESLVSSSARVDIPLAV